MTIEQWIMVWKVVLIGGISLFGLLSIVVIIGGLFDIRSLFRRLHAEHAEHTKGEPSTK